MQLVITALKKVSSGVLSSKQAPWVVTLCLVEWQKKTTAEEAPTPRDTRFTYDKWPSMQTYDKPPHVEISSSSRMHQAQSC